MPLALATEGTLLYCQAGNCVLYMVFASIVCTDMYTALHAMDVQYTCSVQCMHAIACVVHVCAHTHTHTQLHSQRSIYMSIHGPSPKE